MSIENGSAVENCFRKLFLWIRPVLDVTRENAKLRSGWNDMATWIILATLLAITLILIIIFILSAVTTKHQDMKQEKKMMSGLRR
jgi:hypothetical protein